MLRSYINELPNKVSVIKMDIIASKPLSDVISDFNFAKRHLNNNFACFGARCPVPSDKI